MRQEVGYALCECYAADPATDFTSIPGSLLPRPADTAAPGAATASMMR
ncbi:hypothetical protein [Streptomyces sp. NPDC001717]